MHPPQTAKGPCWHCSHFGGWIRRESGKPIYVWCGKALQVQASPQHGCAHWRLQEPPRTAPLVVDLPGQTAS